MYGEAIFVINSKCKRYGRCKYWKSVTSLLVSTLRMITDKAKCNTRANEDNVGDVLLQNVRVIYKLMWVGYYSWCAISHVCLRLSSHCTRKKNLRAFTTDTNESTIWAIARSPQHRHRVAGFHSTSTAPLDLWSLGYANVNQNEYADIWIQYRDDCYFPVALLHMNMYSLHTSSD